MLAVTPDSFRFVQSLMLRRAGLTVWAEKRYWVERQLTRLSGELGLASPDDVIGRVRGGSQALETQLIEELLPTDTHFFRDRRPFEQLDTVLVPGLMAARSSARQLRIWCCAAGTGQEAYSVAMVMARHAEALAGWAIDILATDISPSAVARAAAGRFDHFEIQRGLPIRELLAHFTREGEDWMASPSLRRAIRFEVVNLAHETVAGSFDVILCRNLLMHMDVHVKRALLDRAASALAPDGALLLGATESVIGLTTRLAPDPANPGLYRRPADRKPVSGLQRLAAIA